ncbi:MAG: putative quinol monooxygenase [Niabella sp.]
MLTVIAKMTAKESKLSETKSLLQSLVAPTRKEDGCIQYDLHQGKQDEHTFLFYEIWQSQEALDKHLANTHMVDFVGKADGLLENPMEVFLLNKL